MHLRLFEASLFLIAAIGLNAAEPQISESRGQNRSVEGGAFYSRRNVCPDRV